jgi:pyruvate/2-oxoglutarate dehydrogenase complex dihydrolipoamide acyltransferase (E2) component
MKETMSAADALSADGIAAEVIDLATLKPYDEDAVLSSVATHRDRGPQGVPFLLNVNGLCLMRQFMLPDLGEGLEEAEIVTWYVNEGDHVVTDQPLVSVETDKAVVEIPSPSSGRIAHLFGTKGDIVKVGTPLVEFGEGAEQDTGTIVGELGTGAHPLAAEIPSTARTGQEAQVFPAVRALARKLDVALELVEGTGPGGIITRADVERAAEICRKPAPPNPCEECGARWLSA